MNKEGAIVIVVVAHSTIVDDKDEYLILFLSFCAAEECFIVKGSLSCTIHDLCDMTVRIKIFLSVRLFH
jgi:hypothetical protein